MSNGNFDFRAFITESRNVLVNPDYFSTMKTAGGLTEPLIRAVVYGALSGLIIIIWSLLGFWEGAGLLGSTFGTAALVYLSLYAVLGLFLGGVVMLVFSAVAGGTTDFEPNVRVVAAILVVMPVYALVGFTYTVSYYLGDILTMITSIFALWLLFRGLVQTLKAKLKNARMITYVLMGLVVLSTLAGLNARRKAADFMNNAIRTELTGEPEN